jgi:hypothetical protein
MQRKSAKGTRSVDRGQEGNVVELLITEENEFLSCI